MGNSYVCLKNTCIFYCVYTQGLCIFYFACISKIQFDEVT